MFPIPGQPMLPAGRQNPSRSPWEFSGIGDGRTMPAASQPSQGPGAGMFAPYKRTGRDKAGMLGALLLSMNNNPAGPALMQSLRDKEDEHNERVKQQQQLMAPRVSGNNIYRLDPNTGKPEILGQLPQAPEKPYRWRSNSGDLMEMGADGKPRVAFDDPTDKPNWIQIRDPLTGEIRIINGGAVGGNEPSEDEWEYEGGPESSTPGVFP